LLYSTVLYRALGGVRRDVAGVGKPTRLI
jgi:hypothetical protein